MTRRYLREARARAFGRRTTEPRFSRLRRGPRTPRSTRRHVHSLLASWRGTSASTSRAQPTRAGGAKARRSTRRRRPASRSRRGNPPPSASHVARTTTASDTRKADSGRERRDLVMPPRSRVEDWDTARAEASLSATAEAARTRPSEPSEDVRRALFAGSCVQTDPRTTRALRSFPASRDDKAKVGRRSLTHSRHDARVDTTGDRRAGSNGKPPQSRRGVQEKQSAEMRETSGKIVKIKNVCVFFH